MIGNTWLQFAVLAILPAYLMAVTPGWENVDVARVEVPPAETVWKADFSRVGSFTFERLDGAEGRVSFSGGEVTVEKTNGKGMLVLKAAPFRSRENRPLRFFADVAVSSGDYFRAQAYLCAAGAKGQPGPTPFWELDRRYFMMGGSEEMRTTVNSAPGTTYRKYAHYRVQLDGTVAPAIVIAGAPSKTSWRNWTAEDLDAADRQWAGIYNSRTAKDRSGERMDEAAFDAMIAADHTDHTAKLARVDGVTRLLIDGRVSVPTAYRSKCAFGDDILLETFAGGPVVREGVRLVVKTVEMGGADGKARRYWTRSGLDVAGAVRDIKDSLRIAPDALCILCIGCNAYPDFTRVEHPGETWRLKDGTEVRGTAGSCVATYDDMGVADTNRWPWVSYASPAWRNAIKANIRMLLEELKRTGLSRRIVGVHFSGYHDGQFHSPYPDYSDSAKAEYERFLREGSPLQYDYDSFSRTLGFRAQEDFARAFKSALGKDAIAIRWCMGPFTGGRDLTAFAFSDALDICVPQPTYTTRRPGMVAEMKLPYSSFDLHGKMYWNEFDLRTYGALESWARPGVVATKGLGQSDDIAMWRTVFRKFAGAMLAHDSGFWLYDMGGGWFSPPEIAADVGEALQTASGLLSGKPSKWQPSVALVADETGVGSSTFARQILRSQMMLLAASGVPFEFYLAEDAMRDPSILSGCRTVVLALFRSFDARRRNLVDSLARDGRTLVFLAESGVDGGSDATGFDVAYTTNSLPHVIVPEAGVTDEVEGLMAATRRRHFRSGAFGPRTSIRAASGVEVLARFAQDGAPALAMLQTADCRRVYVCEPAGLSSGLFNRLARESGAYVPVSGGGLQVDMNGSFVSLHALRTGEWDFRLPFPCRVSNVASGGEERVDGESFRVSLTAGQTCWFRLLPPDVKSGIRDAALPWIAVFDDGRTVSSSNAVYSSGELDVRIDRIREGCACDVRGTLAVKGTNAVVSFGFPARMEFPAASVSRFVMPMRGRDGPGIALQRGWFVPDASDMPQYGKVEHGPRGWKSMGLPPVGKRTGRRALERIELHGAKGSLWLIRGNDRSSDGEARRDVLSCIRKHNGRRGRVAIIGGSGSYTPLFTPSSALRLIRASMPDATVSVLESPSAISAALEDDSCVIILNPFGEALPADSDDDFFPMLQRVRKWIDRGGVWIESGGGYPFYRAMVPRASREWRLSYPTANADFMRLERTDGTSLTVFGVQPRPPHEPWKALSAFVPCELAVGVDGGTAWLSHSFAVYVRPGETRTTPVLRMAEGGSLESGLSGYAAANDLALRRMEDKMRPETLAVMRHAPLVAVSGRYAEMRSAIERLPQPTLIRLYSYLHGGFDRQYPDHLPPNERNFGTADDLKELLGFIRAKGHLSSPYTNPTFWCDDPRGPTFAAAGESPLAVARDGSHYKERYGTPWGWTVSPWHPEAQRANRRTRAAFKDEYPVDILFEDQSGARRSKLDFNPSSPAPDRYIEGLLSSSEEGSRTLPLGTEDGWDRMLDIHFIDEGMSWSLVQNEPSQSRPLLRDAVSRNQWRIEPLTQRIFHGCTVMKHHDNRQFVKDPRSLAETLALGYHLNAPTIRRDELANRQKLDKALSVVRVVARVQREVASSYFGRRLESFVHRRYPDPDAEDGGVVEAVYEGGVRLKVNLSPVPREGLGAWGWALSDGSVRRRSEDYPFDEDKNERNGK